MFNSNRWIVVSDAHAFKFQMHMLSVCLLNHNFNYFPNPLRADCHTYSCTLVHIQPVKYLLCVVWQPNKYYFDCHVYIVYLTSSSRRSINAAKIAFNYFSNYVSALLWEQIIWLNFGKTQYVCVSEILGLINPVCSVTWKI